MRLSSMSSTLMGFVVMGRSTSAGDPQPTGNHAGVRATPDSLFPALSAAIVARLAQWDRGAGFAAIRADWISRAAGIGRPVRLRTGEGELAGTFEALDASGRLVLRLADGTMQTIAAGDMFIAKGRSRPSSTG